MKNKQTIAIIVIVLAVAIIGIAGYKILTSYMWPVDGNIEDGKAMIIQKIKNMDDPKEKEESVQLLLDSNKITQKKLTKY